MAHAWLSFGWFRRELEPACSSAALPASQQAVCDASARTQLAVVQLYARPDGIPAPSLGHFDTKTIAQVRAEGELQRYRCTDSTSGPGARYCTIWQQLTPEVLAVSTAKLGRWQAGEDPLADSIILLEGLQRRLAVD